MQLRTRRFLIQAQIEEEALAAVKAGKRRMTFLRRLAKDKRLFAAVGAEWVQVRALGAEAFDKALAAPAETLADVLDLSPIKSRGPRRQRKSKLYQLKRRGFFSHAPREATKSSTPT